MSNPVDASRAGNTIEEDSMGKDSSKLNNDPVVTAGIEQYFKKQESRRQSEINGVQEDEAEEHTGITDDEVSEGDDDYECMSRRTLKAKNQALAEVMKEIQKTQPEQGGR